MQSAPECAASAISAPDREAIPAISFATPIAMFARSAMTIVRALSPSSSLLRAMAERRRGKTSESLHRARMSFICAARASTRPDVIDAYSKTFPAPLRITIRYG